MLHEFHLILCVDEGPIQGCYLNVLTVSRDDLDLTRWIEVEGVDGLHFAFLSPDTLAVRVEPFARKR